MSKEFPTPYQTNRALLYDRMLSQSIAYEGAYCLRHGPFDVVWFDRDGVKQETRVDKPLLRGIRKIAQSVRSDLEQTGQEGFWLANDVYVDVTRRNQR